MKSYDLLFVYIHLPASMEEDYRILFIDNKAVWKYPLGMNITFYGAAQTVTGSCTLLECAGTRILVDCGLPQGADEKKLGTDFQFYPDTIDYILLTHAHIDHSGRIPMMVREGFHGSVHATSASEDLCSIMLVDSGHIQEMEAEWTNRKRRRDGKREIEPLYTVEDAQRAMDYFIPHEYGEEFNLTDSIQVTFTDAGHILGSSSIRIRMKEGEDEKTIVFSGDIGNTDQPLINDPVLLDDADFVVMESTYGDRQHPIPDHPTQRENTIARAHQLAETIEKTFKRGGNVIIPSFAVGRTQEILYIIRHIIDHDLIAPGFNIPVFLDSPLAIEATRIFSRNIEGYFDEEALQIIEDGDNPLRFPSLKMSLTSDDSKRINDFNESCVIISASGMCEAGRIKHHLKYNLWSARNTILFSGYQAKGTLGRSILDGAKKVKIFGENIEVKAEITRLMGMSGHADRGGLIRWISNFSPRLKQVFVVHGDERVSKHFAGLLCHSLNLPAWPPSVGESFDLLAGEFPQAEEMSIWLQTKQELRSSIAELEVAFEGTAHILERMKNHADSIMDGEETKDALRLSRAMDRLTETIEDLNNRWGAQNGD